MSSGGLGILNVGAGDTKLTFDPNNPAECERAAAVVMDMLKRGYAIMVQVGEREGKPLYTRAESFDPATCEYIVMGLPEPAPLQLADAELTHADPAPPQSQAKIEHTRRRGRRRILAGSTHGVAVAPISGG